MDQHGRFTGFGAGMADVLGGVEIDDVFGNVRGVVGNSFQALHEETTIQ